MPLQAELMTCSGLRGSTAMAKTSESSIIPVLSSCQLFPESVVLYARHQVPAYIVLVFRGSIASESIFTGIDVDDIFCQSAPEFFEIQTPLIVPASSTLGSIGDWV